MNTFISEITTALIKNHQSFDKVLIVLPSERAKVFLKREFKLQMTTGFMPEILSIEQFVTQISKLEALDTLNLLFHFYKVYKQLEKQPVSFDVFSGWATTVLQDFNEIDQHLVDTKDIFAYVRDIQRLRKWSVNGEFQETEFIKTHNSFLETLNELYQHFTNYLLNKGMGYQGLLYRTACERLMEYLEKKGDFHYYFVGFNALNKAEEYLFQTILSASQSDIYWDIDECFLGSNHQAGKFIRKYQREWRYYENNDVKILGNHFNNQKQIEIIGATKNITQVKHAAEHLSKLKEIDKTALVLSDETLLPICINSLPENISFSNITMGYPLRDVPITQLFFSLFQLFLSQVKLNKVEHNVFYHKDIQTFLDQVLVRKWISNSQTIKDQISKDNRVFVSKEFLDQFLVKNANHQQLKVIAEFFNPFTTIIQFIDRIIELIDLFKEETTPLEKEYLFRYYRIFNQLKELEKEFQYFPDLKTLYSFFKQLVQTESLSFMGEPLKGLQIMGMLETRVLDFEQVILVSANEGILPGNNQQNSFIPFDVKLHFGLPTYKEKDAIFSYHFFRLLQRAKKVTIIFNTETDAFGKGEKSRFVTQLEKMRTDIKHKMIAPKVETKAQLPQKIEKTEAVFEVLKRFATKGISPSSITNYLNNPINFYKQKVLKIKELEDVEETVAHNTLGNVVHHTLEKLYEPFDGKKLCVEGVKAMQLKANDLVLYYFERENFTKSNLKSGKNRLIFEVAKKFVQNFLTKELELLSDSKNVLKIIAREQHLSACLSVEGLDFPIKIHGIVDRVDELNGQLRIIDYKTGSVTAGNLKVGDFEKIKDYEKHKSIQVLLYAFLFSEHTQYDFQQPIEAGIFSMKKLNSGFLKVDFGEKRGANDYKITREKLDEFMVVLKEILLEIFNPNFPFEENKEAKY